MRFFNEIKFGVARLVWQENPPPRPRYRPGASEAVDKQTRPGQPDSTYEPPPRPAEAQDDSEKYKISIDPDNQVQMDRIKVKLEACERKFYTARIAAATPAKYNQFIEPIAFSLKAALKFRAIVENWTEEDLYSEYQSQIDSLFNRAYTLGGVAEGWGGTKRMWRYVTSASTHAQDKTNSFLDVPNRSPLKLEDIPKLRIALTKIQTLAYDEIIGSIWVRKGSRINEDALEIIQDEAVPFYINMRINEAIAHKWTGEFLKDKFIEDVVDLYNKCLKNSVSTADIDKTIKSLKKTIRKQQI